MDKPVCDQVSREVFDKAARAYDDVCVAHGHNFCQHSDVALAAAIRVVLEAKEPDAPEPVDVDKLVEKMWQAARSCPEVVYGKLSMLAALRVAAEALGQTERLWPKPKTLEERVTIDRIGDEWRVMVDGQIRRRFGWTLDEHKDAETFRRGLIAELEEKEGQSNG